MRIAYLTSLYGRESDSFIRNEVAELRARGHEVLTFSLRKPAPSEAISAEVQEEQRRTCYLLALAKWRLVLAVLAEPLRHPFGTVSAAGLAWRSASRGIRGRLLSVAYWAEAAVLAQRLRVAGAEHLHNHMGFNSAAVAMLASAMTGIPYSLTIHGPDEFDSPAAISLGLKVSRSAFTVAISDYCRSQIMRWTPMSVWDRIHVVRCGVGRRFLNGDSGAIPDEPSFVCVGRLAAAKGLPVLVEAVEMLRRQGRRVQVSIVGDGPLRETLASQIDQLGLGGCVRLLGWRSAEQIREHILSARALVLPSFAEGLPIVLMEALCLHRPVIATQIAAIGELLRPAQSGWLIPAGSASALASAMADAADAPREQLAAMGRAGATIVADRHDPGVQAEQLETLVRRSRPRETTALAVDRAALAKGHT